MFTLSNFKYYTLDRIDKYNAHYNIIFGERSNGKTSAVLERILINWIKKGEQGAYIRRYDEEIKRDKGSKVFSSIAEERGLVEKYTNGEWTTVLYSGREFFLAKYDQKTDTFIKQREPFCFAFAINMAEKYKSTSYPKITTICFDEFLTRSHYLINEFVEFTNLLSTIIRQRNNVKIYMLGNTVNKYCPYFDEMGLNQIGKLEPGDPPQPYRYGKSDLRVVVEYCGNARKSGGKKSDVYFAFDNPKLQMITSGEWELPMYPHAPFKIKQESIIDCFFIEHRDLLMQGDIVMQDESLFVYIHKKTTPLRKNEQEKQIYSLKYDPRVNRSISILSRHRNPMAEAIGRLFKQDLVFYQDNQIGELVRNYIQESEVTISSNL